MDTMNQEMIGKAVSDAAFKVHAKLRPGLFESINEVALAKELKKCGHAVERQKPIPIFYDGELPDEIGFRSDLIVDSLILVELKSVALVADLFKKIPWNYLRLIPLQLGFLINFNEAHLKDGISGITNGAEGRFFFS